MIAQVATAAVFIAVLAMPAAAQERHNPLLGAWDLVAIDEPDATGKIIRADCTGQLIFSADGHVSIQVMYANPKDGPAAYSLNGYEATYGTYRVSPDTKAVTIHVDGALVRSLLGKDLQRVVTLSGDRLTLSPANANEHWKVTWARVAASQ